MNVQELEGVWRLVTFEKRTRAGSVTHPQGEHPMGRLMYDREGRVSAQLVGSEPKAASGYLAYCGTYSVDPATHTVTHRIEACVVEGWVGTEQVRHYDCQGNRLVLSTERGDAELLAIWERTSVS